MWPQTIVLNRAMIKDMILVGLLIIAVITGGGFMIKYLDYDRYARVYDCGMAEWHPDIPEAVRAACRQRYRKLYNKE